MRYAIVSETYPPEINGVALTVQGLEQGLRSRGHEVQLVRPRQSAQDTAAPHEMLVRGAPLPRYPGLRLGLPATSRLVDAWKQARPDAVYVATEGPLGWSALRYPVTVVTNEVVPWTWGAFVIAAVTGIGLLMPRASSYVDKSCLFSRRSCCCSSPARTCWCCISSCCVPSACGCK